MATKLPPLNICVRIRQFYRLLTSSNKNEAAIARRKLEKLLAKHGLEWADIPSVLDELEKHPKTRTNRTASSPPSDSPPPDPNAPQVNVLDLVARLIELHFAMEPHERIAVALWDLHTYVFGRFIHARARQPVERLDWLAGRPAGA